MVNEHMARPATENLVRAHSDALAYLRGSGQVGHGHAQLRLRRGFSVLELIETVKRVFGIDFEVAFVGRRAGDPAQIVAASNLARALMAAGSWAPA
jgi:UDP-glucose 4-epimerase